MLDDEFASEGDVSATDIDVGAIETDEDVTLDDVLRAANASLVTVDDTCATGDYAGGLFNR